MMSGHELAMALRRAYLALHRRTDAALARAGITADQFVVLAALSAGTVSTQRDLVARAASDPNSLRAMLVLLERRGLVERRPHPTDGRARSVSLTREGRRVFDKTWKLSAKVRRQMIAALAPRDVVTLADQLRELAAGLEQRSVGERAKRRRSSSSALS
jgi:DNA-binding MarR family transcriptional regulator